MALHEEYFVVLKNPVLRSSVTSFPRFGRFHLTRRIVPRGPSIDRSGTRTTAATGWLELTSELHMQLMTGRVGPGATARGVRAPGS